ncbi:dihydrofolate reductase family protein [Microbacter sp. GSS18]|nr:dihydrofolate reductase family protein [Microbacter sp. GSS18]
MDTTRPQVVFNTATTLNGFLADDGDSLDWLFAVPGADDAESGFADFLAGVGTFVMGSATYEWVLAHERLLLRPQLWRDMYGDRPAFVLSTRPHDVPADCDIRVRSGAAADLWPEIAAAAGDKTVWLVGGGDVVGQFADAGLLDEVRLSVAPVTLVSGKPLLPRALGSGRLQLTAARQAGQFAELSYAVAPLGTT